MFQDPLFSSQCTSDNDCQWLFSCQQQKCVHLPIFPLTWYPVIIYLLMPFAASLVNLTGNSLGIFKVFIMMNLLRYDVSQSTALIQPMIAGAAIPNFSMIILKRHPFRKTSLVNYSIVYILIPSCLLGSTLGALLGNFIPQIAQDVMIMIVFSYFTYNFFQKARAYKKQSKSAKDQLKQLEIGKEQKINTVDNDIVSQDKKSMIQSGDSKLNPLLRDQLQFSQDQETILQNQMKREKIQAYEDSIHLPDIAISFVVFIAFELLVFLVQGKFPFFSFSKCNWKYYVGISFLIIVTAIYLLFVKRYLRRYFNEYQKVSFLMDVQLTDSKKFLLIVLGGVGAGFMQGVLGTGSGTCLMAVLLALKLPPRVASACSGYQIFFIGSAALIEEIINESLKIEEVAFLAGLTGVFGGLITFLLYRWIKNKDMNKVNGILISIICGLCMISVVGVVPSFILTVYSFGWQQVFKIRWHC